MNLLRNINIKNFRGFDNFEAGEFNQINLLVGKNNSGKSSLLEAVFLLSGIMSNPNLLYTVNGLRGLDISAENNKLYFHKLKLTNEPELACTFSDSSNRTLNFVPVNEEDYTREGKILVVENYKPILDSSKYTHDMTALELKFSLEKNQSKKKSHKSSIMFRCKHSQFMRPGITMDPTYEEELHAVLIPGGSDERNSIQRYSNIFKKKKDSVILKSLQKIDPNIESIYPLKDGIFFDYKGIDERVPSNIAGNGVRRCLHIITAIAEKEKEDNIILIDEIENGLHYSAHKSLWESIIHISKELNTQLFITSHSIETMRSLKELLDMPEYSFMQEKINVFNIAHTKKAGIKAYKYSYEGLKDAIETGTEIRW